MTGSILVPIITPIVAIIALGCWLGMVFWAGSHPEWKTHRARQESQYPGENITPVGDIHAGQPALAQQDTKAA